tara:strand:- start:45 stop:572 length:528 start_codon:yes stop_codon:yes gene_type:complete
MEEQKAEGTVDEDRVELMSFFNGQFQSIADAWDKAEIAEEWGPLPAGKYVADIVAGEKCKSARKGTPGYKLTFKVVEGEHEGRQFWHDIWITETSVSMAKRDLLKVGITDPLNINQKLPSIFRCNVQLALREGDDGTEYNRLKRFHVVSTREFEKDPFAPSDGYVVTYDANDSEN